MTLDRKRKCTMAARNTTEHSLYQLIILFYIKHLCFSSAYPRPPLPPPPPVCLFSSTWCEGRSLWLWLMIQRHRMTERERGGKKMRVREWEISRGRDMAEWAQRLSFQSLQVSICSGVCPPRLSRRQTQHSASTEAGPRQEFRVRVSWGPAVHAALWTEQTLVPSLDHIMSPGEWRLMSLEQMSGAAHSTGLWRFCMRCSQQTLTGVCTEHLLRSQPELHTHSHELVMKLFYSVMYAGCG